MRQVFFVLFVQLAVCALGGCGNSTPSGDEVMKLYLDPQESPADGATTVKVTAEALGTREGLWVEFTASAGKLDLAADGPAARRTIARTDAQGVARAFMLMPKESEIGPGEDVAVNAAAGGFQARATIRVIR